VLALGLAELDGLGFVGFAIFVVSGIETLAGVSFVLRPRLYIFGIVYRAFHHSITRHSMISKQLHHIVRLWI
jgi:hypothetical protein